MIRASLAAALVAATVACGTKPSRDQASSTKEPMMNRVTETDAGARAQPVEDTKARIRALIDAHSPDANPALAAAAADPQPLLRAFAAYQLGAVHHPDALRLLTQLSRDTAPAVRGATVEGLGALGGDDARRLILAFAVEDADVGVRAESVSALKALGGPDAQQALEKLSHDASPPVRDAATDALAQLRAGSGRRP